MTQVHWYVEKLEWTTDNGGVYAAHWRANASDGQFIAKREGTVELNPDPKDPNFVNITDVTEDVALSWVFSSVDKDTVEQDLEAEIYDLANPSKVSGRPWDNTIFSQE